MNRFPLAMLALCASAPVPATAQTLHAHARATLRAEYVPGEVVLELGPFSLPANAGHDDVAQPPPLTVSLPRGGWIRGLRVELVDSVGAPVPFGTLHHVNLIVPDKRELFSPIMLRIGAAGPETAPITLPRLVGYRVRRGDSVIVSAMVHNPTARAFHGVRLRLHLPMVTDDSRIGALSIVPFYLDVMPPAGQHGFDLPPGRSERFWEGKPAIGGRVLIIGGHLHTYGVALRFEDRTTGRVIWEATPDLDSTGRVVGMPRKQFLYRFGMKLHADHVYRLTAVYDNPTGQTIPDGGMGALGGIFMPAHDARWPAVDRQDPQYVRDVGVTFRSEPLERLGQSGHVGHPH